MRTRSMLMGAAAAGLMAVGVGCGSAPTSPTPPIANAAPVIASMSVVQSSYRTGQVVARASDSGGQIASGTVEWGDGVTTSLSGGFAGISLTHRYDAAQSYPIALRVVDNHGETAQQTRTVQIVAPPDTCVDIGLQFEACAQVESNFKQVTVLVKTVTHLFIGVATLTDGESGVPIPLLSYYGTLNAAADLEVGRITLTGRVCPAPLVCQSIGTTVIQL